MLILISPAKTLDFETPAKCDRDLDEGSQGRQRTDPHVTHTESLRFSQPALLSDTEVLVKQLRTLSASEIASLMKMSDKLGQLNADRYQTWQLAFNCIDAKQAVLAFRGDVYQGLNADSFSPEDFDFAQEHLRILSGLYGVLRPLDLIQPYRLEMGTKLAHSKLKGLAVDTLYDFWQDKLTRAIEQQLEELHSSTIINLASNEYFKAVKPKQIAANIITPVFKDWKNGKYKIISFYAKKARGMMSAYIIKNRLQEPEALKNFAEAGYSFNGELSGNTNLVFTRQQQ